MKRRIIALFLILMLVLTGLRTLTCRAHRLRCP